MSAADASGEQVLERQARVCVCSAGLRTGLVPSDQLTGMLASLAGGDLQRARDDRAAPLQRPAPRSLARTPSGSATSSWAGPGRLPPPMTWVTSPSPANRSPCSAATSPGTSRP